jgi:hypothetical protein
MAMIAPSTGTQFNDSFSSDMTFLCRFLKDFFSLNQTPDFEWESAHPPGLIR